MVQVYASFKYIAGKKYPIRSLVAFRRIHLKAGESREVAFKVKLSNIAEPVNISMGGGQPDALLKTTSNVLTQSISNP